MRLVRDEVEVIARLNEATVVDLANRAGVAISSINRAVTVKRWAPQLMDAIVAGRVQLSPAYIEALRKRPRNIDRTTPGTQARLARIRAMVDDGYSEDDIAKAVGVSIHHVRLRIRELGLTTLSDRLHVQRRLDHDAIMERMVVAAEPSLDALEALDLEALDPKRLTEWQTRLTEAIREWTTLRNRLRRIPRSD